jgi:hypothetical protein
MSTDDNLQPRLLREPARFVEDVRVAADGQVQARIWSMTRQEPVWTSVRMPDWPLPLDQARAAAAAGRLIAQVRHRQWMLTLVGSRG